MRLVVDANVLVAAFLKTSVTRELLLDDRLILFAPDHLLVETRKVLGKRAAMRRMGITPSQFDELLSVLTAPIRVVAEEEYERWVVEALELAPHEEDAPYLALALSIRASIWSNDARLGDQKNVRIYTTREMVNALAQ